MTNKPYLAYLGQPLAFYLQEFRKYRKDLTHTDMLFLLSKWDGLHPPIGDVIPHKEDNFFNPTVQTVIGSVKGHPEAWTTFAQLPRSSENERIERNLLQYCAKRVVNGDIVEDDNDKTFSQYNRIIWNWLYGNIFSSESDPPNVLRSRPYLYEDLNPNRIRKRRNYYDSAMRFAVSIIRRY